MLAPLLAIIALGCIVGACWQVLAPHDVTIRYPEDELDLRGRLRK